VEGAIMAPYKRTATGFEMTGRFIAVTVSAITLLGIFVGLTTAGVRAADRLEGTATKAELHDSVRAIRKDEREQQLADSIHEARQDSSNAWYAWQTWRLVCKQSGNPEAFCSREGAIQSGRPR
jgi:hypothetical protein